VDFLYLLGRFHVVVLHVPIGIGLLLIAVHVAASRERYRHLESAVAFLWGALAVTAIGTMALGYFHNLETTFEGQTVTMHMVGGTVLAAVATFGWFLRVRQQGTYARLRHALMLALALLLVVAGHSGGTLTHGSTYLVEYAPQPIRALAGLEPRRPPVADPAMADPYLDVVRPVLRNRCSGCHGTDRTENDLSLWTYDSTLRGGESGRAILPGNAAMSDLIRRVTLAPDHDSFMPQEGKPPLSEDEIRVIEWWIDAGAPTETTVAAVGIPADLEPVLQSVIEGM
jgi:uncharacterized membrane protein